MSNKKKYILIGVGALILFFLFSNTCEGDNTAAQEQEDVILRAQTELNGDLKGCYEVVEKEYKVKFAQKSYEDDLVTVEIRRTLEALPFDRDNVVIFPEANNSSAEYCAGFGIEILNADGDVID